VNAEVFRLSSASAGYPGRPDVLHDLTLAVPAGSCTVLLGENGSGKSTLLKLLARLLPPRRGQVLLDGRNLAEHPRAALARRLGYLPQGFEPFFPATAYDVALLGRTPHLAGLGAPGPEDRRAVERALAEVDASHLARVDVREMSGGERQRVSLARVLAGEPRLLLLDEPTTNLDPRHRLLVAELLRRRAREGATAILSTHELDLAAAADRAVLLKNGRVLGEGAVATTLTGPALSELFEVPAVVTPSPDGPPSIRLGVIR